MSRHCCDVIVKWAWRNDDNNFMAETGTKLSAQFTVTHAREMQAILSCLPSLFNEEQGVRLDLQLGQMGTKWDKSGSF